MIDRYKKHLLIILLLCIAGVSVLHRVGPAFDLASSDPITTEKQSLAESKDEKYSSFLAHADEAPSNLDHELYRLIQLYKEVAASGEVIDLTSLAPHLPVGRTDLGLELLFSDHGNADAFLESSLAQRNQVSMRGRFASGLFEIEDLEELTLQQGLEWIRPAYSVSMTGSVTSQGDAALAADSARMIAPGYSGDGVTVGVLSDSYDTSTSASTSAADDIASGDLPAQLVFNSDYTGAATDEGRAMLQIIHDLAPAADLAFHTAKGGQVAFADAIDLLRTEGCDIIVDDLIYLAEPMFQDGVIAQSVESVVANGALYFSSAGNNGDSSWEGSYEASSERFPRIGTLTLIDFDPSLGVETFLEIDIPENVQISVVLQWSEPFASVPGSSGSASDLNLYMTGADQSLSNILAGSNAPNIGLDPVEIFTYRNEGDVDLDGVAGADTTFYLVIEHDSGTAPDFLKIVIFASGRSIIVDSAIAAPTLYGHANTASAFAVGSASFARTPAFGTDPPTPQGYSALGGVPIYYDGSGTLLATPATRNKPDLVATDGGNTTFFGNDTGIDSDSFPNFFGTSAAAPHAAAVAALLLEKAGGPGSLDRDAVAELFEAGAIDMQSSGFDFKTGIGLIQADTSLEATPLGFPAWRRLELPEVASLSLETDSDADFLPDVLEYYLGTLPLSPNPPPYTQTVSGDLIVIEISSAEYLSAPVNLVESSTNLIDFDFLDYNSITDGENGENDLLRYEITRDEEDTENFIRITPLTPVGLE